jgi:hypothetical protein
MNINIKDVIPTNFSDNSHVWIYQSNRIFTNAEAYQINEILQNFVTNWKSHGDPVKGFGKLIFGQFIIFIADDTHSVIGGCSTDTSVRLIKSIEKEFQISMFDRQMLAFLVNEDIHLIPLSLVNNSLENGIIKRETLYFNNTILTKKELLNNWIIPVKDSWLAKRIAPVEINKG